MHISWLGDTCVKLQTKNQEEDVSILIDPYKPEKGDFPKNLSSNIALFTNGSKNSITLMQDPFTLDTLGECEVKGVMIYALQHNDGEIVFKIQSEGLTLVHLGKTKSKLETALIEKLGKIDVLLIPVGGKDTYFSGETAVLVVNEFEPRIIIPMGYQSDITPDLEPVSNFIKELGLKPEIEDKKIIIKKKDLPTEEAQLMILEKNY